MDGLRVRRRLIFAILDPDVAFGSCRLGDVMIIIKKKKLYGKNLYWANRCNGLISHTQTGDSYAVGTRKRWNRGLPDYNTRNSRPCLDSFSGTCWHRIQGRCNCRRSPPPKILLDMQSGCQNLSRVVTRRLSSPYLPDSRSGLWGFGCSFMKVATWSLRRYLGPQE